MHPLYSSAARIPLTQCASCVLALSCRRSPTPPEVRLQRERERELAELERATRTVFAFNINIKADERDIFGFFSKAGQVHRRGRAQGGRGA